MGRLFSWCGRYGRAAHDARGGTSSARRGLAVNYGAAGSLIHDGVPAQRVLIPFREMHWSN